MTGTGKEEIPQAEAARRLWMSAQALGVWAKRPGAPVVLRKGKPFCVWPDFPKWRDQELDRAAREDARGKPESLSEAEQRYESARAEKLELDVERMRGNLVTVDEATKAMEEKLALLRSALVTLPQRIAPVVLGCKTLAEVTAKLDAAVSEAMTSIAEGA